MWEYKKINFEVGKFPLAFAGLIRTACTRHTHLFATWSSENSFPQSLLLMLGVLLLFSWIFSLYYCCYYCPKFYAQKGREKEIKHNFSCSLFIPRVPGPERHARSFYEEFSPREMFVFLLTFCSVVLSSFSWQKNFWSPRASKMLPIIAVKLTNHTRT